MRSLPAAALALFALAACSTSRNPGNPHTRIDTFHPVPEPRATVEETAVKAGEGAIEGAVVGRRIGRVAGVIAAVFGGPSSESLDDTIDRYRRTRDAVTVVGALIGATKGAMEGAEECIETDPQFAELLKIEGLDATRPLPNQIDVRVPLSPDPRLLTAIANVFANDEDRVFDIEGPDASSLDIREALIELGMRPSSLSAHRADALNEVVIHIRRR